jgi:hypothetical protein
VRENDISADILVSHRNHILANDGIHIVQYYTINGAYFMNNYMRNLENSIYNPALESCIMSMWRLVNTAPALDKAYVLYRFVDTDYLQHLKEGDIWCDPGFVSATRDPFYRSEHYKFGFILMKIHVPVIKGSCLSQEPWSHFAREQEMVIPPYTKMRLIKRNRNAPYFHIDSMFEQKVTTRYEFEIVEIAEPNIPAVTREVEAPQLTDLMRRDAHSPTVRQRIDSFHDRCLDKRGQFRCEIGRESFTLMTEWYNSTIAYKDFYAHMNKRGFSMYAFHDSKPGRILFFIEVVAELHELHVNWYFRWSDDSYIFSLVSESEFLLFLSKLAYQFGIQRVIIYGRYRFCHTLGDGECTSGSYRADVYEYLKDKRRRFTENSEDVEEQFSYVQLDSWHTVPVMRILNAADKDQFYQQVTMPSSEKKPITTVAELYIDTVERHCSQLSVLEEKIKRIYRGASAGFNPLDQLFWTVKPYEILHRHGFLATIPEDDPEILPLVKAVAVESGEQGTVYEVKANRDRINRYRL